jgi:replicative DNA helicase
MTSQELEQYILSACFWPEAVSEVVSSISEEDFSIETHRKVFSAIVKVFNSDCSVDSLTVYDADRSLNNSYLMKLYEGCPTVANLPFYLKKFKEHSKKVRLLRMADVVKEMRGEPVEDIMAVIDKATEDKSDSGAKHISSAMSKAFKRMEEAYQNKGMVTGIPTGIPKIDAELSGLHKTDFILVAARPSIGKTALALQIVDHASIDKKVPSLFISLEMEDAQLASRLVLSKSRINVSKARNGLFTDKEFPQMMHQAGFINDSKLFIEDCPGVTMEQIVAKAKAAKSRHNIGLLIVDYLGLVTGKGTEYEIVTQASKAAKKLAKQLNIPVVCLHQLNRSNLNNRPTMNELRSSGQLEQDADVIILLHRQKEEDVEKCELIIEKNRHGRTGIINATWNGPINRIENTHYEHQ